MGNPSEQHFTNCLAEEPFGEVDGQAIKLFTLQNKNGAQAKITNYGGIVTSLKVSDRHNQLDDVVLGYDSLSGYLSKSPYFGALVGRCGNRIANGRFTLDGKIYQLAVNNGPNHLHGGRKGFDKVVWTAKPLVHQTHPALELFYTSPDGEENYPGTLAVTAIYTLTDANALRLDFSALTDQATIVNLTQHSYFNLAGAGDILGHQVTIHADQFTPVDENLIPTGGFRSVSGTPFDFNSPTAVGARINADDEQLKFAGGYDHNWVIRKPFGELGLMATAYEPNTGRFLEVFSTEPGMQFYSGNFLDGSITGKRGKIYKFRHGFCMEPQHYPDSPNKPAFPSIVLRPGEVYRNTIIYKFSTR